MHRIELSAIVVLAAVALAAIACGQPLTTAEETQTAVAVASPVATTTPDATLAAATAAAQPTSPSPPQLTAEATPQWITPVPASGVRSDCPEGWAVAQEQRFSFCYPMDSKIVRSETDGLVNYNFGSPPTPTGEERKNTFFMVIAEQSAPKFDIDEGCVDLGTSRASVATLDVSGLAVSGCLWIGRDADAAGPFELRSLRFVVDLGKGPIDVLANYRGPDFAVARATIDTILRSIQAR